MAYAYLEYFYANLNAHLFLIKKVRKLAQVNSIINTIIKHKKSYISVTPQNILS